MSATNQRFRQVVLTCMLFLLAGWGNRAMATHFAAADLYVDFLDSSAAGYRYQVTAAIYKACEPNNAGLSTQISVSISSACGFSQSLTLPSIQGPDTLDQLCPDFAPNNACRVPSSIWPAFVRYIYQNTVTFPSKCSNITISWSGCDRNYGVQNIQAQSSSPKCLYIEVMMNTMEKVTNNTPRFTVDPIPYLCVNQPSFFLNGPVDPDNDSVVTTNVQPLSNAGIVIPYLAGYNLANPIGSSTGYNVNANTGTASFTPTTQGKFVLAFEAADYKRSNGVLLSHIRRDVQVSVLNCNAPPPNIDTTPINLVGSAWVPTPPSGGYIAGCAGQPLSFNISGSSNANTNSVFLSANNTGLMAGSDFTVAGQGTNNPVGTFSWTPTNLDVGDYTLIIVAKDSTCTNNQPIVMKNYFTVQIRIYPSVEAGPNGKICKLDGTPWQFNVQGPQGYSYRWTGLNGGAPIGLSNDTILNPTAYPPFNFTYVVEAVNFFSVCKNKDTVTVYIDTSNAVIVTPHEEVVCRPGYFQINATGIGLPPLANLSCGVYDTVGCTVQDTVVVNTQYAGGTQVMTKVFSPYQSYRTSRIQFLLTKNDLRSYGIISGTLKGLAFNVTGVPVPNYATYNNFTISLKCTDRESLDAASGGLEPGATLVYTAATGVTTSSGWNQFTFDRPYSVDSTKSLIIEICYNNTTVYPVTALPQINAVNTGSVQTVIKHSTTNTGTVGICQNPSIVSATDYYNARPQIRFNLCEAGETPFRFVWTPGDFLSDSTVQSPLAYVKKDIKYIVTTQGRNGCKVQDSIQLRVPIHHYDVWPKDTTFCYGASFLMKALGNFAQVKWYEGEEGDFKTATTLDCDDCREPVGSPKKDTKYFAVMTDADGCSDTMMVFAEVRQLPIIRILNKDTTIKYGQSIQLLASGGYLYSWQPLSSISSPNLVNPYASPTEPTTYYVYGIGENGCRNVDSVHVDIDYRDNLFVPSAFTPNGDGKNDEFRVSNITFQKLQEFRVFNRWGQEIFSTTDPKKGWDGNWKGVPQDIGTYQYLIRVAYPDGYIETYKGNVTLMR